MDEPSIDSLMVACRTRLTIAFLFAEDQYFTDLLSTHLTEKELVIVKTEEDLAEVAQTALTMLIQGRMTNATTNAQVLMQEDMEGLSATICSATRQSKGRWQAGKGFENLLDSTVHRYASLVIGYCALINPSQRTAMTTLTMATAIYAIANRVSMDEAVKSPVMRAQVLKKVIPHQAWLNKMRDPQRRPDWVRLGWSIQASVNAVIDRRSREIWG